MSRNKFPNLIKTGAAKTLFKAGAGEDEAESGRDSGVVLGDDLMRLEEEEEEEHTKSDSLAVPEVRQVANVQFVC